jgi:glycine/D-amino acid oxidase-like deaminating enzyme
MVSFNGAVEGVGELHIVVIGGGALGLSSALHLVERGVSVTVLEADALASGSTGRSIGVVGTQHVTALDVAMRAYVLRRPRLGAMRTRVSPDRLSAAREIRSIAPAFSNRPKCARWCPI